MPSRYPCMRKFPDYQAALLNQNSNDISTPSDKTCYFFGIKPVTLQDSKQARSLSGLLGAGGQRVLHQECCRSHHVISA